MTRNQKKKILYVITKSNWGGAQRYVYDLATNLPDEYEPVVALGGAGVLRTRLKNAGIRTIPIKSFQRDIRFALEFRAFGELVKIVRAEQPDIVHLNSSKAGGLGALAARINGVPHIIFTAHGWYFKEDRSFFVRQITWLLSLLTQWLAHTTIAVSENDAQLAPISTRTITIPIGITAEKQMTRSDARNDLLKMIKRQPAIETSWVGTIAELHKNKGLEYLVAAAAQTPHAAFFIIGGGEEQQRLSTLIREQNMTKRVHLLGEIPDAARYLSAFDIFVLPSTKEGLPYTLLEAGVAGLPVVATTVGGIPEIIIDNETGLLVPPKNPYALATALSELCNNQTMRERLGTALRQHVTKTFSGEQMFAKTLALYKRATH